MTWLIRAYRDDDELALERSLGDLSQRELERRLGFAATRFGSTPLDAAALSALADLLRPPIDADLHWFLDFDVDPRSALPDPHELRIAASTPSQKR